MSEEAGDSSSASSPHSNSNSNGDVEDFRGEKEEESMSVGGMVSPFNGNGDGDESVHSSNANEDSTPAPVPIPPLASLLVSRPKRVEVETKVIQVANIAPQATREQMMALFGYIGKIDDLRLYPTMDISMLYTSKICFVKFRDGASVGVAQHLTNTVFVDRALIVVPYPDGEVPDESFALELLNSGSILPGIADPKLPQHVTSQLEGIPPMQMVVTTDPLLTQEQLPSYPNLPPTFDSRRIEEIRRTIMLANLDHEMSGEDIRDFFGNAGEVKYLRACTRDNDPLRYALVEFTEQPSVLAALKCNGTKLGANHIKVYHSTQAIVKPQAKTNEAAQKEIEEAMTRQAQNLISQGLDGSGNSKDKRRSRSMSPRNRRLAGPRRMTRSRSRSPRRRSPSRSRRRRSRSRSPRRVRRSRSRSRGRVLRSPWRHRSRSRSRDRTRRSTSKSRRSKRSSSRDRKRDKEKKAKKDTKERDRERDKSRRSKDRDWDTTSKDTGKENGVKSEEVAKEESREKADRDRGKDRGREHKKRKSVSKSPTRDKRRSSSRDKRKRSKSKKKKRGDSDREESIDDRTNRSRNTSADREPIPMETN